MITPSPRQIKAARALLGWTMHDLAEAANVGRSTVADYERGARATSPQCIEAVAEAAQRAGVVFLSDGVRLDAAKRVAAGVRAITSKQQATAEDPS